MRDIYTEAAEKIEKALFIHRRQFSDDISDIAAILEQEYGAIEKHGQIWRQIAMDLCTPRIALATFEMRTGIRLQSDVMRPNGDGTGTITERKE